MPPRSRPTVSPASPSSSRSKAPGGQAIQFYSAIEAPVPGFKGTGASPFRLGHVAIINPDGDKAIAFFTDFLGFVLTDDIAGIANFLTCNREHHVVNLVKAPDFRVHHIAFELRDSSCHCIAADALRAAGVNMLWGPSRHTAGHNVASYHYDPEGDDRVLYRDGSIHPRTRDERAAALARAFPDEAQELGPDGAERLGSRLRLQPRHRLNGPAFPGVEQGNRNPMEVPSCRADGMTEKSDRPLCQRQLSSRA